MKTLFAVVLATVMMAAPVQAADNVVDADTMAAVDTEVEKEIARLSEVSPAVALAMKSEASKKQMYAIIAGSVLAAAGLYALADWYFEIYFFKKPALEAAVNAGDAAPTSAPTDTPAPEEADATV